MDKNILQNFLAQELDTFVGEILFSNYNGHNNIILEDLENSDNELFLHCTYKRDYYQVTVKLKDRNAVAGWNKSNKDKRGIPVNITIAFEENYDSIVAVVSGHYNGSCTKAVLLITDDGVSYDEFYEDAAFDSMEERLYTNVPFIDSSAEVKTIEKALETITEMIRVKLSNVIEENWMII